MELDLTGHFRLHVSERDEPKGATQPRGTLHKREKHSKTDSPFVLDDFVGRVRKLSATPETGGFHQSLGFFGFLDPACGCGNFLVITYRELRLLEIAVLRAMYNNKRQGFLDVREIIWLDVDAMYGIEYEEFPAQISAGGALAYGSPDEHAYLQEFGQYFARLPLKKAATIVHADALLTDWQSLLSPVNTINVVAKHANIYLLEEPALEYKTVNVQTESYEIHKGKKPEEISDTKFDFILGNPPFIGSKIMTQPQRDAVVKEFDNIQGAGVLGYCTQTAWYVKAAKNIFRKQKPRLHL